MLKARASSVMAIAGLLAVCAPAIQAEPRRMENLGRGVVAVRASADSVFVSWRLLGVDPPDIGFNLYRATAGGAPVRLNDAPLTGGTNYRDAAADLTLANAYYVRPVVSGIELPPSGAFTLSANAPVRPYLAVPLRSVGDYYVQMVWVGDLDGDGEYDYVLDRTPSGTGTPKLEAYRRDGTFLWRVDMGPLSTVDSDGNDGPAASLANGHADHATVYDLDGDGRAEVVLKTANGTVFGDGSTLSYGDNQTQFISVLDGLSGAERARATVPNPWPGDGGLAGHFGVMYCDGVRPSFVFKAKNRTAAGAFNLVVTTWDYREGSLTQRWSWTRDGVNAPDFQQIRIVDVDGDGRDELCDGGYVLNANGTFRYALPGVGHGDRFHIGDLDPDRPGLEGFGIQQNNPSGLLYYIYDAATGATIRNHFGAVEDTGRGTAADIDPAYRGYEYWSFHGIHDIQTGLVISPDPLRPWPNFRIWWDGDVLSESLNRELVEKWNPATSATERLITASDFGAVDTWRDAAQLYGDILGDWREEVVYEKSDHSEMMIFTTTTPSDVRLYTLPHNPAYRACMTVKGYKQSHMLDYYLGDGMLAPPPPNIVLVPPTGAVVPVISSFSVDTGSSSTDRLTNDNTPTLSGAAPPGATVVVSRLGIGRDGAAITDGTGVWTYDYAASPLTDGFHAFTARVDTGAGDIGQESSPFFIQIDTVPPAAPLIEAVMLDGSLKTSGSAEPGLTVSVTIEGVGQIGSTISDAQGAWSVTYDGPALPPGAYAFAATAVDAAANTASSAPTTVDTSIAQPLITAVLDDTGVSAADGVTADSRIVLQGTALPGATVSLVRFGAGAIGSVIANASGDWSFDYTGTALAEDRHTFTALASNGVGVSPGAPPFSVTVDLTAPIVVSVNRQIPTAASTSATEVTFRVTFDGSVTSVDALDFALVFTDGLSGAIQSVNVASPASVDVVVGPLSGEGTVRLDVNGAGTGIADVAGNAMLGGFGSGQIYTRILEGDGVWIRTETDGLWSDNANWEGGIVANGAGTTADFTTLEVYDDVVVHLDAPRTVAGLAFGDTDVTSPGSWILDGNGDPANALTFAGGSTITVKPLGTGAVARIDASLAGTAGVTKMGTGTLVLAGSNALTGSTSVGQGVLRIDAGGTLPASSVTVGSGGAQLNVSGGSVSVIGTATVNAGGGSAVIVDAGAATFGGLATNNSSGGILRVNGGTVTVGSVTLPRSTDSTIRYGTGFIVTGGSTTAGTINLGWNNSNGCMSVEGGSLLATGAVTLGNQSSGGRGGHMRVTGGTFTASDTANGIIVTRRNNNVSDASFLGGVSTVEKMTLGYDATVVAGSATVDVNGGALYLGSGGIVKNGADSFVTNVNLMSGILGAQADWSTALPITLPAGGAVVLKAADAADVGHAINLNGVVSGAGGLTKTGDGVLTLTAASTFTGAAVVEAGMLQVDGSLAAGATLDMNGGTLSGVGTLARPVVLNAGARIVPGGTAPGSVLAAESLTWNGAGQLSFDLSSGNRLVLTGALSKSGAPGLVTLSTSAPLSVGAVVTLATYSSTDLLTSDLAYVGLPGYLGVFLVGPTELQFLVTGTGPTAQYSHWAYLAGLPAGQSGPDDDPDDDGMGNLLEFVLGRDPLRTSAESIVAGTVDFEGRRYPSISFVRRIDRGGVTADVLVSGDLRFSTLLGAVEVSAMARGDGMEDVIARSAVPLSRQPRQFFRLAATLPAN